MGPLVSGLRASLSEQGYSALVVRNMLKDVGALGRWMQEHLSPTQDQAIIASFEPLLRFLRSERVTGEPSRPESALERLLVCFVLG